ncbi:hypothetical protein IWW50_005719, partial [Coemansia erecta]
AAGIPQLPQSIADELPEGFPALPKDLAADRERYFLWAHLWRSINKGQPASTELTRCLLDYLNTCTARDKASAACDKASAACDNARRDSDKAFDGLGKASEHLGEANRRATARLEDAEERVTAAEERVATAAEAVAAVLVPAPVEAAEAPLLGLPHVLVPHDNAEAHLHQVNLEFPLPDDLRVNEATPLTAHRMQDSTMATVTTLTRTTYSPADQCGWR